MCGARRVVRPVCGAGYGRPSAVQNHTELSGAYEPVTLRHVERRPATTKLRQVERLGEHTYVADVDRHSERGPGEVLPVLAAGEAGTIAVRLPHGRARSNVRRGDRERPDDRPTVPGARSEEHTSELQSLMRISY